MKYEEGFVKQQTNRNHTVNYILCGTIFAIECVMVLIWYVSQHTSDMHLGIGYQYFYWAAIIGSALHMVFNYLTRGQLYRKIRILIQMVALFFLLAWAVLFAAYDVQNGNSGSAFTQILIATSAGIWMPRGMHYAINTLSWAGYVAAVIVEGIHGQLLYSEIINSGIFLLLSYMIIHVIDSFQYSVFKITREWLRLQNEQLDLMAEQVRAVHDAVEGTRIMRHDLRHYAKAVEGRLRQKDWAGIWEITAAITEKMDWLQEKKPVHIYTKIPEVDTILSRCGAWAEKEQIKFQAELPPPDMMEVRDVAMLLMNALENAVNAVRVQPATEERYIKILGARYGQQYYLNISNTYQPGSTAIDTRTGLPTPAKPGHGYGTKSIAVILKKYQAHFRFQAGETEFSLQMLIPTGDVKASAEDQPASGELQDS